MKELVIISGKGGTGKTSLAGALAALAKSVVIADCDVDASDLPLILSPTVRERHDFMQGHQARVDSDRCAGCGACQSVCRFDAIVGDGPANQWSSRTFGVDRLACEGCGACMQVCPRDAVTLHPVLAGHWFVSDTRLGPLVHAVLGPGGQNSGKLVSQVRQKAHALAKSQGIGLVLVDGSPGIGCPVIASVARADLVLIVTEPTPSGLHDLERVIGLTEHFRVPAMLCVNRWDLHPEQTANIERLAMQRQVASAGRVRVDAVFNAAQRQKRTVTELPQAQVNQDIGQLWTSLAARLSELPQEKSS